MYYGGGGRSPGGGGERGGNGGRGGGKGVFYPDPDIWDIVSSSSSRSSDEEGEGSDPSWPGVAHQVAPGPRAPLFSGRGRRSPPGASTSSTPRGGRSSPDDQLVNFRDPVQDLPGATARQVDVYRADLGVAANRRGISELSQRELYD